MTEDDNMCNKVSTGDEVFNENVEVMQIFTLRWIDIKFNTLALMTKCYYGPHLMEIQNTK